MVITAASIADRSIRKLFFYGHYRIRVDTFIFYTMIKIYIPTEIVEFFRK